MKVILKTVSGTGHENEVGLLRFMYNFLPAYIEREREDSA